MFEAALIIATLLCGLVAGLLFGFAVVAMPGMRSLDDRGFIRAFQSMDRIIQNNHPMFVLVWIGSVVALITATISGLGRLDGAERLLLVVAAGVYLFGVQVPTAIVNIPLNNRIQRIDADGAGNEEVAAARLAFEPRWNRWNRIRTAMAASSTALLLVLLRQM